MFYGIFRFNKIHVCLVDGFTKHGESTKCFIQTLYWHVLLYRVSQEERNN